MENVFFLAETNLFIMLPFQKVFGADVIVLPIFDKIVRNVVKDYDKIITGCFTIFAYTIKKLFHTQMPNYLCLSGFHIMNVGSSLID